MNCWVPPIFLTLHHDLHLLVLLQQLVDLLHAGAGTRGDPPLARGVQDLGPTRKER
jgi:hypothetical protein